jgi:hypothetical protein
MGGPRGRAGQYRTFRTAGDTFKGAQMILFEQLGEGGDKRGAGFLEVGSGRIVVVLSNW